MLEVKNLSYKIKNKTILHNISFHLQTHLAIVGESGSGKSTLGKILCKLIKPQQGSIYFQNKDITHASIKDTYKHIQYVFQSNNECFDPRYTIKETFQEISDDYLSYIKKVHLSLDVIDQYPRELSGGQLQRLSIARALMFHPEILILDEATSALDLLTQKEIIAVLEDIKKETLLIVITHDLALGKALCNSCIVMHEGCIVENNTMDEIINHPQNEYTQLLIHSIL